MAERDSSQETTGIRSTHPEAAFREGDRVVVTGPGYAHGEIGTVTYVRNDGAVLVQSEKHGDRNYFDPRCLAAVVPDGMWEAGS